MKRAVIFVLTFLSLNVLLMVPGFQRFILSGNDLDYFYTGHDWNLKFSQARHRSVSGKIVFLGTSRTVYGVDPSVFPLPAENLGLIAASYEQILEMARILGKNGDQLPAVFVEVNPIALSDRFTREVRKASYQDAVASPGPLTPGFLPVIRYRSVLGETIRQLFQEGKSVTPALRQELHDFHIDQFLNLDKTQERGFLRMPDLPGGELRSHLLESCLATANWAVKGHEFGEGLRYLHAIVTELKKISPRVLLWIPPVSEEWDSDEPQIIHDLLLHDLKKLDVPTIDLQGRGTRNAKFFNDCMHANQTGAKMISEYLLDGYKWAK